MIATDGRMIVGTSQPASQRILHVSSRSATSPFHAVD